MSVGYVAIGWSGHKRVYDACVAGGAVLFVGVYVGVGKSLYTGEHALSDEVLILRALGACAITLLHAIVCIGPLARLDRRLLPVLYNRRHLGVMTFLIALVHGVVATGYYHGFSDTNPLLSLIGGNTRWTSLAGFPFQVLGLGALAILFMLAATSHDFWLKNLTPRVWKSLHMSVYVAYALLVAHVALGALQTDRSWLAPSLVLGGAGLVCSLHLAAGVREARADRGDPLDDDGWIDAGPAGEIPPDRARTICTPRGERIAVYRHAGGISAITNVCAHQGGPLGEGKVIDGCVTCPWHGWQYRPQDGRSPPPFTEKIATHEVRISAGRVRVNPRPLAPGTPVAPAPLPKDGGGS